MDTNWLSQAESDRIDKADTEYDVITTEGAYAFRQGVSLHDCPYECYRQYYWKAGWSCERAYK